MVTLLCVETREPALGEWAIEKCTSNAQFAKVVLITDLKKLDGRVTGINYFQSPPIRSIQDYSKLMMSNLIQYISGTHVLVIQWDSFITNPDLWDQRFLRYDYIGPVWPHHPETPVGNGGFSLRSTRLLKALTDPAVKVGHPEDYFICVDNKQLLEEKYGIQFAPVAIAEQFAVERTPWHPAFGFHGFFNFAKVVRAHELIDLIERLPNSFLKGLDTYDLANDFFDKRDQLAFNALAKKVSFTWKMRYRYLGLKFRYLFS